MPPRYYFAYGSNMNAERVDERGIGFDEVLGGRLSGFGLRFQKISRDHQGAGHANIVYSRTEVVEGVMFRLVDEAQIVKMDPFERAPVNYSREVVTIATHRGDVTAWTYFANSAVIAPDLKPPRWYLDHLLAGGEHLSAEYLARLEAIQCAP